MNEKVIIYKPRRDTSEKGKPIHTLIMNFKPPIKINFYCFSHPVVLFCYGSPGKLTQVVSNHSAA
jgi:hypothetical protein